MAYVKELDYEKKKGEPIELAGQAPIIDRGSETQATISTSAPVKPASNISGAEYLGGNLDAVRRLAEKVEQPATSELEEGKQSLAKPIERFASKVQQYETDPSDEKLRSKAFATPEVLSYPEQERFRQLRTGEYTGPKSEDFSENLQRESKLRALTNLYTSQEGLETQLPTDGKFTPGMKRFDAMLLRQDPTVRARLESREDLVNQLAQAREAAQSNIDSQISAAKDRGRLRGEAIKKDLESNRQLISQALDQQVQQGREQAKQFHQQISDKLATRSDLTADELHALGISPEDYNEFRNVDRVSKWDYTPPQVGGPLGDDTQDGGQQVIPESWTESLREKFDISPFLTQSSPEIIDAARVITPEQLARYRALTELSGLPMPGTLPERVANGRQLEISDVDPARVRAAIKDFLANPAPQTRPDLPPTESNQSNDIIRDTLNVPGNVVRAVFCYTGDTKILLANNMVKLVKDIQLNDELYLGGKVTARGEAFNDDIYSYKGTNVSGSHAILEDGIWLRVKDSKLAERSPGTFIVYPIVCEHHIMVPEQLFISADLAEIDDTYQFNDKQRIDILNLDSQKTKFLNEQFKRPLVVNQRSN